jgi:Flp pilus assembly protein TadB
MQHAGPIDQGGPQEGGGYCVMQRGRARVLPVCAFRYVRLRNMYRLWTKDELMRSWGRAELQKRKLQQEVSCRERKHALCFDLWRQRCPQHGAPWCVRLTSTWLVLVLCLQLVVARSFTLAPRTHIAVILGALFPALRRNSNMSAPLLLLPLSVSARVCIRLLVHS